MFRVNYISNTSIVPATQGRGLRSPRSPFLLAASTAGNGAIHIPLQMIVPKSGQTIVKKTPETIETVQTYLILKYENVAPNRRRFGWLDALWSEKCRARREWSPQLPFSDRICKVVLSKFRQASLSAVCKTEQEIPLHIRRVNYVRNSKIIV